MKIFNADYQDALTAQATSVGSYGEDDIVRFEDRYGRT